MDVEDTAWRYLRTQREALLWKVEGLGEHDLRVPRTPTGTNLLGVVKHLAGCEIEYFGACLGRPFPDPPAFLGDDAEDNADMWATEDESASDVLDLYRRAVAWADATIAGRPADSPAHVPWWGRGADTDLHTLLVHMAVETARHVGHLDILREQADGARGLRDGVSNLPTEDAQWWAAYVQRLRGVADRAAARYGS
jgi:uncharacterized damage-inducible protein DinB